MVTIGLAFFI